MNFNLENLRKDEQLPLILGQLYSQFGYKKFKMEKFEEYDFYAKNKDYLKSHKLITFPNSEGKLVALKPDITLSIIKNAKTNGKTAEKRYYTESVYRVSKYTGEFTEISQTGLEYLGKVTENTIAEVISLASRSMAVIGEDYVLSIASADFLSAYIFEVCDNDYAYFFEILDAFPIKNETVIDSLYERDALTEDDAESLKRLMKMYGNLYDCLPELSEFVIDETTEQEYEKLKKTANIFHGTEFGKHLMLDFSIVEDIIYYNSIVFQGYVKNVPHCVLSGGQYDSLLRRMDKENINGIGFAVYQEDLERYIKKHKKVSLDTMILYNEKSDFKTLNSVIDEHIGSGKTFFAETYIPEKYTFDKIIKIDGKSICEVNKHD